MSASAFSPNQSGRLDEWEKRRAEPHSKDSRHLPQKLAILSSDIIALFN
jgi:hypothetical protein